MKPGTGLSFNASHPLHKDHYKRTMPKVPGRDAESMAATGCKTTRNWRLHKNGKLMTPGVNTAKPCGGFVSEAQVIKPIKSDGNINQRHAKRRMKKVQANNNRIYW